MLEQPSGLHHQLIKFASQYSPWADARHLGVMCWMMVGLIAEGSVNLTKWIDHIQTKAKIAGRVDRPDQVPKKGCLGGQIIHESIPLDCIVQSSRQYLLTGKIQKYMSPLIPACYGMSTARSAFVLCIGGERFQLAGEH